MRDLDQLREIAAAGAGFVLNEGADGDVFCTNLGGYSNARTIDKKEKTVEAILSTNKLDRYGEIMEPDGWQLKNYKRNPIVLFNHQDNDVPVGMALDVAVRDSVLWGKLRFAPETSQRAAEVWGLVAADILRAWSPGWYPIKWETIDGELKGDGASPGRRGIRFTKMDLWENSIVTIPAAPDALTLSVSRYLVETAPAFGHDVPDSALPGEWGLVSRAALMAERATQALEEMKAAASGQSNSGGPVATSVASAARSVVDTTPSETGDVVRAISRVTLELVLAAAEIRLAR